MLDVSTLTAIRAAQATALPDTCTIQTVSGRTSDGAGGESLAWADTYTSVPCRLMFVSPPSTYTVQANQPVPSRVPILTCAHDQTISPGMRVLHGEGTYSVLGVNEDASWITAKRATLERVEL